MQIKVIRTIDDPFLKKEWERLEKASNIFPQSTYHWCATWWKYLSGNRELYLLMLISESGVVAGMLPLCLESRMGFRILRNFPINYGDFFKPIINQDFDEWLLLQVLFEYLNAYQYWDAVLLQPVNSHSTLYQFLSNQNLSSLHLIGNIVANLQVLTWDDYLFRLSANRRKMTQKKMRKLEKDFSVKLERITSSDKYFQCLDRINALQVKRWENDNRPKRSKAYIDCTKEINARLFEEGKMVLYLLKADEKIISYRIGLIYNQTYYDWNTNYDLEWEKYSPGLIGIAYVIRDLIARRFNYLDFMAGIYDYKISYSPLAETRNNYMFIFGRDNIRGKLIKNCYLKWRPLLKSSYTKIQKRLGKPKRRAQNENAI